MKFAAKARMAKFAMSNWTPTANSSKSSDGLILSAYNCGGTVNLVYRSNTENAATTGDWNGKSTSPLRIGVVVHCYHVCQSANRRCRSSHRAGPIDANR